jgi:hypothetical protein
VYVPAEVAVVVKRLDQASVSICRGLARGFQQVLDVFLEVMLADCLTGKDSHRHTAPKGLFRRTRALCLAHDAALSRRGESGRGHGVALCCRYLGWKMVGRQECIQATVSVRSMWKRYFCFSVHQLYRFELGSCLRDASSCM